MAQLRLPRRFLSWRFLAIVGVIFAVPVRRFVDDVRSDIDPPKERSGVSGQTGRSLRAGNRQEPPKLDKKNGYLERLSGR
jgi:hypothetical protein